MLDLTGGITCVIIRDFENFWQLNHEVPKIKFCDGTFYTGGILNGLFHGDETLTLPNGDTLTAMFNQNTVESNGVFTNQFGTYSGEFYPEMVVSAGYDFS